MPLGAVRQKLRSELETPRAQRPFGSGWLSGTLGLLAGAAALLMVVALRYPTLFTTPELAMVRGSAFFRPVLYVFLVAGFCLAGLSLLLRRDKTLGLAAMTVALLATGVGSLPGTAVQVDTHGAYFGLDFFVLNVLFAGLLFIPLERVFPHQAEQTVLREEWREDLFYYLISSMMVQVLAYLTLAPSRFILDTVQAEGFRGWVHGLPWIVQLIAVMLLTDLVQYWVHRLFHQVPALWRFHAVHHSARSMDWMAGARMHFIEIIVLRSLTATPMFVLGFDQSVLQAYLIIVYVYSGWLHANVELPVKFAFLEKILASPRFHHWHHGIEKEAIDVNFAIHFPLLDRVFGTHHLPKDRWPSGYGIGGHPVPLGYVKQFLYPFRRP
ncbi:sterol desaturase family protein [uncultured Alsobacter sp.]|uniref:sterol desaturase family protein n=1 Tax=uncultured Alsobacter sp. TaxID=1748258 RepID=UPI0025DAD753|nr:sterol desaturase family protein [uncultured Alsobacter sp.]